MHKLLYEGPHNNVLAVDHFGLGQRKLGTNNLLCLYVTTWDLSTNNGRLNYIFSCVRARACVPTCSWVYVHLFCNNVRLVGINRNWSHLLTDIVGNNVFVLETVPLIMCRLRRQKDAYLRQLS